MTAKKFLLILVAAFLCIGSLYSQGFNSVYSKDGASVIAVGNNGNVFRSYDGGVTFGSYPLGAVNLNSIYNFGGTIIIAGNAGTVYYSSNDGLNWSNQTVGAQNLNSVSFYNTTIGWAVGDNGAIYKSTNGGINWSAQSSPNSSSLRGVKATGTLTAVACGDNGSFIYTNNGGTTWNTRTSLTTKKLMSIDQIGSEIIATGEDGFILKYNGSSLSYIDYKIVSKSEVRSVCMVDANTFYSCGGGGFINKSVDGGISFIHQKNPMIAPLSSIYFSDANTGWAVASTNNAIMRTVDGGTTWNFQGGVSLAYSWTLKQASSGNIGNGFAINPLNKNSIFCCMGNKVYRSLDRGNTWTMISTVSLGSACHTFVVNPNDSNVFLASMDSGGGRVMKSTNYGVTWTMVWGPGTLTSYGMPLEFDQNNPGICYLAPDNAVVMRSTDFGSTWTNWGTKIFRSPCDVAVQFENSDIMWVADGVTSSGSADFWKSTNNGINWTMIHGTSGSEIPMIATTSLDLNVVYHTTWSSGGFWKSSDQGTTFSLTTGPASNLWGADIAKDDPNAVMYGQYGSTGYLSTDAGTTFITQNLVSSPGAGALYYDKATCLMQQGGGVLKLAVAYTVTTVTGNQQISGQAPQAFSLVQNFPNPFNPTTQIKYNVSKASYVSIKVFDILGNEVKTLVSRNLAAGRYNVDFDASQLASGVYFYSLFSDGAKMDSKKMLLVK